jgi:hypothetical protein
MCAHVRSRCTVKCCFPLTRVRTVTRLAAVSPAGADPVLHKCDSITTRVTIRMEDYVEMRQRRLQGAPDAPEYAMVVSTPDTLKAVHLPSAAPEFVKREYRDVECLLCGHSSDDLGPLALYETPG